MNRKISKKSSNLGVRDDIDKENNSSNSAEEEEDNLEERNLKLS